MVEVEGWRWSGKGGNGLRDVWLMIERGEGKGRLTGWARKGDCSQPTNQGDPVTSKRPR